MSSAHKPFSRAGGERTDGVEEMQRIIRLVQFARASALDIGEHGASAQLLEVERQLVSSLERRAKAWSDEAVVPMKRAPR